MIDLKYLPGNHGGYRVKRNTPLTNRDRDHDAIPDHRGNVVGYYRYNTSDFDWHGTDIYRIDKTGIDANIWKDIVRLFFCERTQVKAIQIGLIPDIHIRSIHSWEDISSYFSEFSTPIFYSLREATPWAVIGNKGKISTTAEISIIITNVVVTVITRLGEVLVSNPFNIIINTSGVDYNLVDGKGIDLFGTHGKLLTDR